MVGTAALVMHILVVARWMFVILMAAPNSKICEM